MGDVKFENNAVTTLLSSVSIGDTTFVVASAATFPTLGTGDWMHVTIGSEFIKVTGASGTTYTCEPITADHSSGVPVELRMCKELLDDFATDVELATGLAGKVDVGQTFGKNLFINPEGLVNQEAYVDGAATTEAQHIFDMYAVDRATAGAALKVTRSNGTLLLDNVVTGAASSWLRTWSDDIDAVPDGDTVTISGEVTTLSGGNFALNGYGCNTTITAIGTYSVTFVKDTSDTTAYNTPFFKYVVDASQSVTIGKLKFENGSVATVYTTPRITDNELACYRYMYHINTVSTAANNIVVGSWFSIFNQSVSTASINVPVSMSKIPTITFSNLYGDDNDGSSELMTSLTIDAMFGNKLLVDATIDSATLPTSNSFGILTLKPRDGVSCYLKIDARPTL